MNFCLLLKTWVKMFIKILVKIKVVTSKNLLIMLNSLLQMHLKLLLRSNFKKAESTGGLTGKKIAEKITKVLKISPKNASETTASDKENMGFYGEIPKDIYPQKKRRIVDELQLI